MVCGFCLGFGVSPFGGEYILLFLFSGETKEILCEDNTILWISKLCSCVSVR